MTNDFDVLVVGGGIAGVSVAYELSAGRRVGLVEMESTLAFHTTGRSAATFLETYGGAPIRALTTSSRDFLENPPGILDASPLSPMPMLHTGAQGRAAAVEQLYREVSALVPDVELLDEASVLAVQPLLRPGYAERAVLEPGAREVDVHALHQGFLRGLRANQGSVTTSARIVSAERAGGRWTLTDRDGRSITAEVVVNAAGAWADVLGAILGARPIGLEPLRRSVFTVAGPPGARIPGLPMTADIDETFYVKPEGDGFLCSPADVTPQEPGDAKPDELEIARAIDAINEAMTLNVRSVRSSWAGLRSFVADHVPVVGYDPEVDGLFWYAGQGGYGIQIAPALARTGAALLAHEPVPADVAGRGLTAAMLAPARIGA